jgi:hypothetical protein
MSYTFDPGFSRGLVLGALWSHPIEKTDPLVTGASVVGTKKDFTDVNPKTGGLLSNEIVTCIACRNTTAAPVLPGAQLTVKGAIGVVDEYLRPTGCPVNEIFWLVVGGPTQSPLGTRVTLLMNGTAVPRTVSVRGVDGTVTEEPEVVEVDPAVTPDESAPVDVPAEGAETAPAPAESTETAPAESTETATSEAAPVVDPVTP